ncbi:hypothetical protein KIV45_19500 [Janthinobacterium lividum]|nr:hypothetical protein KIV45_19500 [Janthinobacterium lividum]
MSSVTVDQHTEGRKSFEKSMKALESQLINAGADAAVGSKIRLAYSRGIKAMAQKLENSAQTGKE